METIQDLKKRKWAEITALQEKMNREQAEKLKMPGVSSWLHDERIEKLFMYDVLINRAVMTDMDPIDLVIIMAEQIEMLRAQVLKMVQEGGKP